MPSFSVNHMTMANASHDELIDVASALNCVGIELRTDLAGPQFRGPIAAQAARSAHNRDLRILALSEVTAFNDLSDEKLKQAKALMKIARSCGAEAISLIPRNDGLFTEKTVRLKHLRETLIELAPLLRSYELIGMIEPLGFKNASLRFKADVIEVIESLNDTEHFKIVHDTFHHYLTGEDDIYPAYTGIVHVSGVVDSTLKRHEMQDCHRGLVDEFDCLDNIGQIRALLEGGYKGPFSYEAFSPQVHAFTDPKTQLFGSFNHITSSLG